MNLKKMEIKLVRNICSVSLQMKGKKNYRQEYK